MSRIGGGHAVGINDLAWWKMDAIWTGPGRSGNGLQRTEACHLSTHATAWSFYHLALTRSLILGLCRYETQWIGTGARLHPQEFKPGKVFFPPALLSLYKIGSATHNARIPKSAGPTIASLLKLKMQLFDQPVSCVPLHHLWLECR